MEDVEVKFGEWIEKGFKLYKENMGQSEFVKENDIKNDCFSSNCKVGSILVSQR